MLRWTESIALKVKRKKKVEDYSRKEIWQSVFEPCAPSFAVGNGSEFTVSLVVFYFKLHAVCKGMAPSASC